MTSYFKLKSIYDCFNERGEDETIALFGMKRKSLYRRLREYRSYLKSLSISEESFRDELNNVSLELGPNIYRNENGSPVIVTRDNGINNFLTVSEYNSSGPGFKEMIKNVSPSRSIPSFDSTDFEKELDNLCGPKFPFAKENELVVTSEFPNHPLAFDKHLNVIDDTRYGPASQTPPFKLESHFDAEGKLINLPASTSNFKIHKGSILRSLDTTPELAIEEKVEDSKSYSYKYEGTEIIDTVEKAIIKSGIDLSKWSLDSSSFKTWTTSMKIKDIDEDGNEFSRPEVKQNYGVTLKFKPISKASFSLPDLITGLNQWESMSRYSLLSTGLKSGKPEYMLELDVFDAHFGKLCWAEETGDDYDLKIATERYTQSISDIVSKATICGKISKILLPIGNDFFHTDNTIGTTTGGTRQDVDSRWQKAWNVGVQVTLDTIRYLSSIAPVEVIGVGSNHDTMLSYMLANLVRHIFSGNPNITVNDSPKTRKLAVYGNNAIMFTHGNTGKLADYPLLMLREFTKELVDCSHLEIHLGHFHKNKSIKFISEDEHQGVMVRFLRSISGTDSWHYNQGYTSGTKGAEGFLFHFNDGMTYNIKSVVK